MILWPLHSLVYVATLLCVRGSNTLQNLLDQLGGERKGNQWNANTLKGETWNYFCLYGWHWHPTEGRKCPHFEIRFLCNKYGISGRQGCVLHYIVFMNKTVDYMEEESMQHTIHINSVCWFLYGKSYMLIPCSKLSMITLTLSHWTFHSGINFWIICYSLI